MVEVTPKSIRLRKALLDPNDRKKGGAQVRGGLTRNRRRSRRNAACRITLALDQRKRKLSVARIACNPKSVFDGRKFVPPPFSRNGLVGSAVPAPMATKYLSSL